MPHRNIITEESEDAIWKAITEQLNRKEDNLDYTAQFSVNNYCITLDIDIHPDRGDENEKPFTSFSAPLVRETDFRFRMEKQGLKHQIGKLFGMQDIIIGQPEVDKKFLIQSNNEAKVKELLSDANSATLLQYPVADFEIKENKIGVTKEIVLRLDVEGVIMDPAALKSIFEPFKVVLNKLD